MQSQKNRVNLFNGLAIDLARGCVMRSGQAVHLRPLAYEVLKYLVENRGHLISKDRLIAEVWRGRAVTDGSLGKCIEEVREALGPESRQYIRNVRGRGYIFDSGEEGTIEIDSLQEEQIDVVSVTVTEEANEPVNTSSDFALSQRKVSHVPLSRDLSLLETAPTATAATSKQLRQPVVILLAGLVALAAAGLVYLRYFRERVQPTNSIAVLPFVNGTGDADKEYLSDGISESIINRLSQLSKLRVLSRNSVFRYKGREVDAHTVGTELGAQAVLTGRVFQHGDELSISVELVRTEDNTQIWGEQYKRKFSDVVSLHSEIAREVSRKLQAQLSAADEQLLVKNNTANADAYELYLKGRYYSQKLTLPEMRKGISFFQQAIDLDPTYALAYAGMAAAYRSLAIGGWGVPSKEAYPQGKAIAMKALEIDPNLPEARIALGWIAFLFDWDWDAAETEFKKAIELAPNNADAHVGYAHLFSILGRGDEAITEIRRARELDPLSLLTNSLEGQFLFYAGRLDEARTRFEKTLEIDHDFWIAHNGLGRVYIFEGKYDQAIGEIRKAMSTARSTEPITQLGYALAVSGRQREARQTLAELRSLSDKFYVPFYSFAMIHHGLGEKEEALEYLEKSLEEREVQITFIKIDRRWDNVRAEPRFVRLMQRVGFEA